MIERFEDKFLKTDDCWIWNAAMRTTGYGVFSYNGKPVTASRVSYLLYKGDIPDGLHVLHTCDNRRCVNPEHLFLGTNKDNVEDRKAKGRRAGRLKVADEAVIEKIKTLLADGLHSYRAIAKLTGVSRSTVQRIKHNDY